MTDKPKTVQKARRRDKKPGFLPAPHDGHRGHDRGRPAVFVHLPDLAGEACGHISFGRGREGSPGGDKSSVDDGTASWARHFGLLIQFRSPVQSQYLRSESWGSVKERMKWHLHD